MGSNPRLHWTVTCCFRNSSGIRISSLSSSNGCNHLAQDYQTSHGVDIIFCVRNTFICRELRSEVAKHTRQYLRDSLHTPHPTRQQPLGNIYVTHSTFHTPQLPAGSCRLCVCSSGKSFTVTRPTSHRSCSHQRTCGNRHSGIGVRHLHSTHTRGGA